MAADEETGAAPEPPPSLDEGLGLIGAKLDDAGGVTVGRIERILVDAAEGTPAWVVARVGRFGSCCAVPYELVAAGAGRAWVPLSREAIRVAPAVDPSEGLTCAEERALAAAYGLPVRSPCSEASPDASGSLPAD